MSGELMAVKTAYRVVVLPLPVGPVTRMIPLGDFTSCRIRFNCSAVSPSSTILRRTVVLFSSLRTHRSPNEVGIVETRTSISWSPILTSKRPSWGSRFSAMFILAMTLILEVRTGWTPLGGEIRSYRIPSIRERTLKLFLYGSKWISLARAFTDWEII